MAYRQPKKWKPKDPYTPNDFNQFVKANMEALARREADLDLILTSYSVSNDSWTNTSWQIHPRLDSKVVLEVTEPSMVILNFQAENLVTVTGGDIIYYDVHWEEADIYLSSWRSDQDGRGVLINETEAAGEHTRTNFQVWVPNVAAGTHTFQLWVKVSADTARELHDAAPFHFGGIVI